MKRIRRTLLRLSFFSTVPIVAVAGTAPCGWCASSTVLITAQNQQDFVMLGNDAAGGNVFCRVSTDEVGAVTPSGSGRRFTPYASSIDSMTKEIKKLEGRPKKSREVSRLRAGVRRLRRLLQRYQTACAQRPDRSATPVATKTPRPATPTPAPTKPSGNSSCKLTECSAESVSYSCATPSRTVNYEYCGASNTVSKYTIEYTNGHVLICHAECTFGNFTSCSDDTGASCRIS